MSGKRRQSSIKPSSGLPSLPRPAAPKDSYISISFRLARPGKEYCLSRCRPDEVQHIAQCFQRLTSLTWNDAFRSDGLKPKSIPDHSLKKPRPSHIDEGQPIIEVRTSQKGRIFGLRAGDVFHVIWFDPNHEIVDG